MKKYFLIIVLFLLVSPLTVFAGDFDFDCYGGIFTLADESGNETYGSVPTFGIRGIFWNDGFGFGLAFEGRSGEGNTQHIGIPNAALISAKSEFSQAELDIGVFFRPTAPSKFHIYGGLGFTMITMEEALNADYYYYSTVTRRYWNTVVYQRVRTSGSLSVKVEATGFGGFGLIGVEGEVSDDISLFAELKVVAANAYEKDCLGNDVQLGGLAFQGGIRF